MHSPESTSFEETSRLQEMVLCRLGRRVRDLRVIIRDDGIVLQGHAPSYYFKQLAQQAVMEATTRPIVVNEIKVRSIT